MKKIFTLSLIVSSIILIGCGGDSNSDDGDGIKGNKESVDSVLSKSEAAIGVPSGIDFSNKTSLRLKQERKCNKILKVNKKIKKLLLKTNTAYQKEESFFCSETGTASRDTSALIMSKTGTQYTYDNCLSYNKDTKLYEYLDGISFVSDDKMVAVSTNYISIPDYVNSPTTRTKMNLTIKMMSSNGTEETFMNGTDEEYVNDILIKKETFSNITVKSEINNNIEKMFGNGEMEEYEKGVTDEKTRFNNLVMIENKDKKTWFFEGGFGYTAGCFSEYHVYNTKDDDWLVESKENSNEWSSGTLYIDNAEYDYHDSDVTVIKQGKKGIFTQQELLKEIERKKEATDCSMVASIPTPTSTIAPTVSPIAFSSPVATSTPTPFPTVTPTIKDVLLKSEVVVSIPSVTDYNDKNSLTQEQKSYKDFKIKKKIKMIQQKYLKENTSHQKGISRHCSEQGIVSIDTSAFIMSKTGMKAIFNDCLDYDEDTKFYEYSDGSIFLSDDEKVVISTNYISIPDYVNFPTTRTKFDYTMKITSSNGIEETFMDGTKEEYVNDILIKKYIYSNMTIKSEINDNIENMLMNGEMEEYEKGVIDEKIKFNDFEMIRNNDKRMLFLKGGFGYTSGCLSEYHVYNTKETNWLVESKENSDEWSSGTLYVDNAEYNYYGSDVMVIKEGKKGRFTQKELLEEIEKKKQSTNCSI